MSKIKEIYRVIYPDIQTFMATRNNLFGTDETETRESISLRARPDAVKSGNPENDKELSVLMMRQLQDGVEAARMAIGRIQSLKEAANA